MNIMASLYGSFILKNRNNRSRFEESNLNYFSKIDYLAKHLKEYLRIFAIMESKRQIKYGKQLQKDLAGIFQQDPTHYFGSSLGTITEVNVSPDLSLARVYLSIFPINKAEEVFNNLETIKSEIRLKLGKKIGSQVRIIPELAFFHDDTEEKASKIDNLINNLNIPPSEE